MWSYILYRGSIRSWSQYIVTLWIENTSSSMYSRFYHLPSWRAVCFFQNFSWTSKYSSSYWYSSSSNDLEDDARRCRSSIRELSMTSSWETLWACCRCFSLRCSSCWRRFWMICWFCTGSQWGGCRNGQLSWAHSSPFRHCCMSCSVCRFSRRMTFSRFSSFSRRMLASRLRLSGCLKGQFPRAHLSPKPHSITVLLCLPLLWRFDIDETNRRTLVKRLTSNTDRVTRYFFFMTHSEEEKGVLIVTEMAVLSIRPINDHENELTSANECISQVCRELISFAYLQKNHQLWLTNAADLESLC